MSETRSLERAMGSLFVAGWTIDDILSLTWDQVSFVVYAVNAHRMSIFLMVQEAVVHMMGGKVNKKKGRKKSKRNKSTDEAKLRAMAAMGISVGPEQ